MLLKKLSTIELFKYIIPNSCFIVELFQLDGC